MPESDLRRQIGNRDINVGVVPRQVSLGAVKWMGSLRRGYSDKRKLRLTAAEVQSNVFMTPGSSITKAQGDPGGDPSCPALIPPCKA